MPQSNPEKFPAPAAFEELSGLDLSHLSSEERAAILEVAARAKQIDQVETRRVKTIQQQVVAYSAQPKSQLTPTHRVTKKDAPAVKQIVSPSTSSDAAKSAGRSSQAGVASSVPQSAAKNSRISSTDSSTRCHFCDASLAESVPYDGPLNQKKQLLKCNSCGRDVCKSCLVVSSVLAKKGEVLCKLCIKQRELAARTNVWLQKRPPVQLHRSASADASKIVKSKKDGGNDSDNAADFMPSRQRSLSADATNLVKDNKTKIKMSVSEALVRQLSAEQEPDRTSRTNGNQVTGKEISHLSTNKPEVSGNGKMNHLPSTPSAKNSSSFTQIEVQKKTRSSKPGDLIKLTKPENKCTESSTRNESQVSTTKNYSPEKKKSVSTETVSKAKEIVIPHISKVEVVEQNSKSSWKPPNSFGPATKNHPLEGYDQCYRNESLPDSEWKTLLPTMASTKVDNTEKDLFAERSMHTGDKKLTNEKSDVAKQVPVAMNPMPKETANVNQLGKKDILPINSYSDTTIKITDEKKVLEMRNPNSPKQCDETVNMISSTSRQTKVVSSSPAKNYATNHKEEQSKVQDASLEKEAAIEEPTPLQPAAKQNEPAPFVARRSSIDDGTRSMPNTTSICSSLAESEGPAEWSVDELDDNDTLFLVTSSDGGKGNLPTGVAKPSDLLTAIEACEEPTTEGAADGNSYDFMSYEDDTEGDFDQFLQDEKDAMMQYTGSLKRVSLFHDLSSMSPDNDKYQSTLPKDDTAPNATNKTPDNVRKPNTDTNEMIGPHTCAEVEQQSTMSTSVKNTITHFESQNLHRNNESGLSSQSPIPKHYPASLSKEPSSLTKQNYQELEIKKRVNVPQSITTLKTFANLDSAPTENFTPGEAKLCSSAEQSERGPVTKPVPAKRKTTSIPSIKITGDAHELTSTGGREMMKRSPEQDKAMSGLQNDLVQKSNSTTIAAEERRGPINRSVSPVQSSVYVSKFGSKVLQPAPSPKLPVSPLVTAEKSKDDNKSPSSDSQVSSSSSKVWAVHKAGYFDSDSGSESGEEEMSDDEEKELLKFATSSVPIHPEEMEEYSSSVVSSASPSSRMFFRRTTSTDSFEDLLKRATETPRNRKSAVNSRMDKLTSRFSLGKKPADDESSIARSVSLSPPHAADDTTKSDGGLTDQVRRKSEPLICQSDMASQPDTTGLSNKFLPSSSDDNGRKVNLIVSLNSATENDTTTQTQSNPFCNNVPYSTMVRCVSCGVLSNQSEGQPITRAVSPAEAVKLEPPKSLATTEYASRKCHSVSSSTQVTPDQPAAGFPFFPSVDLCQLTALIEALKNVQTLGSSKQEIHGPIKSPSTHNGDKALVLRTRDASTETSLTGEPIVLLNDRVVESRFYRSVENNIPSPNRKPNTAHACVGTRENVGFMQIREESHGRFYEPREPNKHSSSFDGYHHHHHNIQTDFNDVRNNHPYHDEMTGFYGTQPHYSSSSVYDPYTSVHRRPAHARYPRNSQPAGLYHISHMSSLPSDRECEWSRPPRAHHWHRPWEGHQRYRGEGDHVFLGYSGRHRSRDEYWEDDHQDNLNEAYVPENAEFEMPPRLPIRRPRMIESEYDSVTAKGTLTTLPNNNFNLRRSASVPAVARQDQIPPTVHNVYHRSTQPVQEEVNRQTPLESAEERHDIRAQQRTNQQPSTFHYGNIPTKSHTGATSHQLREGQSGRSIDVTGSSYTLASIELGTNDSEFSNEGSDDVHRSPSKRTLPQPPAEDEFRWRYNNNKRFNTLTSGRTRTSYGRDFQQEVASGRSSGRLRQTMEDLDQEEKELDLRLRYLELGRQNRSTTHSSITTLHQAPVSTVASGREYEMLVGSAYEQANGEETFNPTPSRQASVLNLNDPTEAHVTSQRNYVIVDDVTHIVSNGSADRSSVPRESMRAANPSSQSGSVNSNRVPTDALRSSSYRGGNNNLHSGWSQMEAGANYMTRDGRPNHRSANQHLSHSRTPSQSTTSTHHAFYALRDPKELDRAFVVSQNDFLARKIASSYRNETNDPHGIAKGSYKQEERKNYDYRYLNSEREWAGGQQPDDFNRSTPLQYAEKLPATVGDNYHQMATKRTLNVDADCAAAEAPFHEEDLRTVVSDSEAYSLRQELNDWFDKPRDQSRRKGAAYVELSNDDLRSNC